MTHILTDVANFMAYEQLFDINFIKILIFLLSRKYPQAVGSLKCFYLKSFSNQNGQIW